MQVSKGGKQPTVLASSDTYEPQPAWHDNPNDTVPRQEPTDL